MVDNKENETIIGFSFMVLGVISALVFPIIGIPLNLISYFVNNKYYPNKILAIGSGIISIIFMIIILLFFI